MKQNNVLSLSALLILARSFAGSGCAAPASQVVDPAPVSPDYPVVFHAPAPGAPAPGSKTHSIRVMFENGMVQVMDLEAYLRAVVPGEVPATWPEEAVKAQIIAARGYAQYAVEHPRHAPHADVCTTTHCQYYNASKIHPKTDELIRATRGIIALYQGKTVNSVFSARCGGHTNNNEDVWHGTPVPYMRGVECPDKGEKHGHGIGLCQHGARVFASQGRTYEEIIKHYYWGAALGPIPY